MIVVIEVIISAKKEEGKMAKLCRHSPITRDIHPLFGSLLQITMKFFKLGIRQFIVPGNHNATKRDGVSIFVLPLSDTSPLSSRSLTFWAVVHLLWLSNVPSKPRISGLQGYRGTGREDGNRTGSAWRYPARELVATPFTL